MRPGPPLFLYIGRGVAAPEVAEDARQCLRTRMTSGRERPRRAKPSSGGASAQGWPGAQGRGGQAAALLLFFQRGLAFHSPSIAPVGSMMMASHPIPITSVLSFTTVPPSDLT